MIRQQSSQEELKRQVAEYHSRPPLERNFLQRPDPIHIANPNVLPGERLALNLSQRSSSDNSIPMANSPSDGENTP